MQQSAKATWLCAIIFPFLMLLLVGNALVFDETAYKNLLRPGAVNATMQLLDYFQGRAEMPAIFDVAEKAHLADVKHVISLLRWVSLALLAAFLALTMKADVGRALTKGFGLLVLLLLLSAFIPFGTVFTYFHKIFFPQGNWVFPSGSMLILLYPETFFQAFFLYIVSLTVVFSAVLAVYGYTLQKQKA